LARRGAWSRKKPLQKPGLEGSGVWSLDNARLQAMRPCYHCANMTPAPKWQAMLREISQLLQMKGGETPFKVRAYDMAADAFETLPPRPPPPPGGLNELVKSGRLSELEGVGKAIDQKVTELVTQGSMKYLEDLRARVSPRRPRPGAGAGSGDLARR